MINQALFSSKDKSKKLRCRLLQFLFGALWVNSEMTATISTTNSQTVFLDKQYRPDQTAPEEQSDQVCTV